MRAGALRISEPLFNSSPELAAAAAALGEDPDPAVRYQLALSLGEWNHPAAGQALGRLARKEMGDIWMRSAILSSSSTLTGQILDEVIASPPGAAGRGEMIGGLISTAVASGDNTAAGRVVAALARAGTGAGEAWRFTAWASLIDALERRDWKLEDLMAGGDSGGPGLSGKLDGILAQAGRLAFDEATAPDLRRTALRLYGFGAALSAPDWQRLLALFASAPDPGLRDTALQALRRHAGPGFAVLVLQNWTSHPPATRAALAGLLLSRDIWTADLLGAMEKGVVSGMEIAIPDRGRFLNNQNASIRSRAEKVFAALRPEHRAEVLAAYRETASLTGSRTRGAEVFQLNCSICHFLRGTGHAVGPDISLFRGKAVPEFLEAILDPNAVIEPRFLNYMVELKDGRFAAGIITGETANSLTLVQPGGQRQSILRPEIKEIQPSPVSLMREGFEQNISPWQMADLIAYVKGGQPSHFGSATPGSAAAAKVDFGQAQANGVARVTAASTLFDYPSWLGTLPFAHCHQTDGTSRVVWESAPVTGALQAGGTLTFRFPGGMGHFSQPAGTFQLKVNGSTVLEFGVQLHDYQWSNPEGTVQMDYEVKEAGPEDSNGIFTVVISHTLLTADLLTPGQPVTFEVTGAPSRSRRWFGVYVFSRGAVPLPADPGSRPPGR